MGSLEKHQSHTFVHHSDDSMKKSIKLIVNRLTM